MTRIRIHPITIGTQRWLSLDSDAVRACWAALTANPTLTTRQLARCAGLSIFTTALVIRHLEELGYIEYAYVRGMRSPRACRILVPLMTVHRTGKAGQ